MPYWGKLVTVGLLGGATMLVVMKSYERLVAPRLPKARVRFGQSAALVVALVIVMSVQVVLGWMPASVLIPTLVGALLGVVFARGVRKGLGREP